MNSCRYDCFITIYGFCLRDIIKNNNINYNEFIIILDKTFEELLSNPNSKAKFILWNYFAEQNIEPMDNELYISKNNINNDISQNFKKDLGIGEQGYICQLFKIFKNVHNFCIIEFKNISCNYCNYNKDLANDSINQFFQINLYELNKNSLEEIFYCKYKSFSYQFCINCQLNDKDRIFPKSIVKYYVNSYPIILFILFDLSFDELKSNKDKIKNLTRNIIILEKDVQYSLIGIISAPNFNHFTCFIYNYEGSISMFNLEKGKYYLHDGLNNNGNFIELTDDINNYFDIHIPYILIYKKLLNK